MQSLLPSSASPAASRARGIVRATRVASLLALALVATLGCVSINLGGGGRSEMEESVLAGSGGPKVLLLDIDGEITASDASGVLGWVLKEGTVSRVRDQLSLARKNGDVAAILLRIDSPGGSPTASDAVYRQLLDFKERAGIPVVAQFMSMGTSGAYFIAMAADEVVATRTSITGSIGVVLLGVNLSGLMDKIGVENQTFTSGPYKDAGSWLRPMTDAEHEQLQTVIDDLYDQFVSAVDAGRPGLTTDEVRRLADGRIYSASQALDVGLIDRVDDLETTIDKVRERLGATQVRVVAYHRKRDAPSNIYTRTAAPEEIEVTSDPLSRFWPRPGFYYVWLPGLPLQ